MSKEQEDLRNKFEEETNLKCWTEPYFNDVGFSDKYVKWIEKQLLIHSVSDCFSFARYLNENFHYFDNTDVGDVYKDNDGQSLYSEKDIYDEWLNNR